MPPSPIGAISSGNGLLGRDVELALVRELVTRASSVGASLLVRGEPGIGKTSLLGAAETVAAETGLAVLRARGTPAEQHLPFAGLHLLLRPVLARRHRLASGHQDAIERAFGLVPADGPVRSAEAENPPARFVVALAALELLADAAAEQPLLLTVDDAQWLDDASAEVMAFVGRRIESESLVLVMTTREVAPAAAPHDPAPELVLAPLQDVAARELLVGTDLTDDEVAYVLNVAGGNPLALLELPLALRRLGHLPEDDDVPLTARLESVFGAEILGLPRPVQLLLLALAMQDSGSSAQAAGVARDVAGSPIGPDALEGAVAAGLVATVDDAVTFRHPLVRSAVLRRLMPSDVRAVHRAWAQALGDTDPDRAAWHRAATADGPDDALAAELEAAADRAFQRGALTGAQRWLERAGGLTGDRSARQARLLRAGEVAYELGRFEDVQRLLNQVRSESVTADQKHRLERLEGIFDDAPSVDESGVESLVDGAVRAQQDGQTDLALLLLMGAGRRCWWGDLSVGRVREVAHGLDVAASDPRRLVIDATAATLATAKDVLCELDRWSATPPVDVEECALLATAAFNLADFDKALRFADPAVASLRAQGRLSMLAQLQVHRAWAAIFLGRWDVAYIAAAEAYSLAIESRQPVWAAHARLGQADLEGRLGKSDLALQLLVDAEQLALLTGRPTVLGGVEFTRGIIELGRQRPAAAFGHLRHTLDPDDVAFHSIERLWLVDYVTEAAAESGHLEEARFLIDGLEETVGQIPSPGYSRALRLAQVHLASDDDIDERVEYARASPGPPSIWFSARLDLAWGMSLRRRRRVTDSRRPLRRALLAFDALGASGWSQRARTELAAAGDVAEHQDRGAWLNLSPQELQIAQLAAEGLSNREIGSRLYLSHRTVGSHLYRMFPKLGIRSRAQLHRVMPPATSPTDPV
jgi:DNA-binding CsgD family transcriptional regulator